MASVGQMLKNEREKKGLTLRQIEKETRIREKYLQAVELESWETFPSRIYINGIISNYSKFLGLDEQKLLAFFRRDYERKDEEGFKKRVPSRYVSPQSKRIAFLGVFIVCIFFIIYFTYQLGQFLSPPDIMITSPQSDRVRATDHIQIIGRTEKEASITIYGEKVYPNKEGIFTYAFPVKKGANELVVEVVGANGKKSILKKTYIKE